MKISKYTVKSMIPVYDYVERHKEEYPNFYTIRQVSVEYLNLLHKDRDLFKGNTDMPKGATL